MIEIVDASTPEQILLVRQLLLEYQGWLGFDLSYQGFEQELATLPGKYAPPRGALLLAYADSLVAGMIAMRPMDANICEMKRLYVRPSSRGSGVGRLLINSVLQLAQTAGYSKMRLDTIRGKMDSAIALYRSFGFHERAAYYDSPVVHTLFLEKDLKEPFEARFSNPSS